MKIWVVFSVFLAPFLSHGQANIAFHSITELDRDTSSYKIILISAPWCGICKANQKMIENSEPISKVLTPSISFFKIENDFAEVINFDHKTYHFVQRGPSIGTHQFIDFLIAGEEIKYPTFVLLNSENEKVSSYQGFVNESDWLGIFGEILNHFESPDSVTSN